MANKPAPKNNWNDVQVAIATVSMVTTLAAWNLFAGPDRAAAMKRAQEQAAIPPAPPTPIVEMPTAVPTTTIIASPTPLDGKVLFGGKQPQTVIVVQQTQHGGGGGGTSSSGGGGVVVVPPPSTGGGGGGGTGGS